MDRRRFCTTLLAGAVGGSSGCSIVGQSGRDSPSSDESGSPTATERSTVDPEQLARFGNPSDICEAGIVEDFSITEIADPAFSTDWTGYDVDATYVEADPDDGLADDAVVVGIEHEGQARAYPLSVLWHHEIVNDTLGVPLVVTYCSICRSGPVARRVVRGEPTKFGVSGQLWRPPDRYIVASEQSGRAFGATRWNATESGSVRNGANLVMYDVATRSFWSQGIGQAICGPMAGTVLEIVPSTVTSWADWREEHGETDVLLPPPHSTEGL